MSCPVFYRRDNQFFITRVSGLSQVTLPEDRTRLMAWYNLFGCFSSAAGALVCGAAIEYLRGFEGFGLLGAYRATMGAYALVKVRHSLRSAIQSERSRLSLLCFVTPSDRLSRANVLDCLSYAFMFA